MKKLLVYALSMLSFGSVLAASFQREIPAELKQAMKDNEGKIVIYHTGEEKITLEGKERIKEDALTITGPTKLFFLMHNSTKTINVPGSGNKQFAVFTLKPEGSELVFEYASTKTDKQWANWKQVKEFQLAFEKTRPMYYKLNTADLKSKHSNRDLSTIGIAYFRNTRAKNQREWQNYLVIYCANGNWLETIDLEKGTPGKP